MNHCGPGFGQQPRTRCVRYWFLCCVHDLCGAQSLHLSDPRGIQPGANISQGKMIITVNVKFFNHKVLPAVYIYTVDIVLRLTHTEVHVGVRTAEVLLHKLQALQL